MKIAVLGYSGCGKSTLAQRLSQALSLEALHLDQVHWLSGWREQDPQLEQRQVEEFLNSRRQWVIDGNYLALSGKRRLEEADVILLLQFSRLTCLRRILSRWRLNRGQARPSMTPGCPEKLDREFLTWVLFVGRSRKRKKGYRNILRRYPQKALRFTSPRQLERWEQEFLGGRQPREEA